MKRAAPLLACVAFLFSSAAARADETASLRGLLAEEVVTSASRSAEQAADAPALSRSISAEELRRYGISSIDGAIDFLGVGARTDNGLGASEISVRGVGFTRDKGNHVLLLVDGHVINEPLLGSVSLGQGLGVPLELIDHIEVILGPGSAMYGSNAVLAVVNVITKSASAHEGAHVAAEGSLAGSGRATLTAGYGFDLLGKRASLTAGLTHYRADMSIELRPQYLGTDPYTGQPLRYTTTGPATGIWGGRIDRAYRSDVSGTHVRLVRGGLEIMGRAVVASSGDPGAGSDFDSPLTGTLERRASTSVRQRFALGDVGELSLRGYGDVFLSRDRAIVSRASGCPFIRTSTCDYRDHRGSDRLGAEAETTFDWLHDGRLTSTAGTNATLEHVSGRAEVVELGSGRVRSPLTPELDIGSVWTIAGYAQQGWRPLRWLNLNAGGRVDWRQINDDDGELHTFTPVFTPRGAIVVQPWEGASVKAIYAEAFRAPNPYEADAHTRTLLRASSLEPERASSKELVLEQRVHAQRMTFSLFDSRYNGVISRVVLTPDEAARAIAAGEIPLTFDGNVSVHQYRAADVMTTRGFTAGFDGSLLDGRLHLGASFTGAVARGHGTDRIPVAPQAFGNARAAYELGGELPTVALAASFTGSRVSDRSYDAGFRPIPVAPGALDLRVTLTGSVPHVRGLSYRVIVAHAVHDRSPFAVGPLLRPVAGLAPPELAPVQRWNATLGVQYDF